MRVGDGSILKIRLLIIKLELNAIHTYCAAAIIYNNISKSFVLPVIMLTSVLTR